MSDMHDIEGWAARYDAWFAGDALPLWAGAGMDRVHGGAHELLGLDGRPVETFKRARVQARQVFVYAAAHRAGYPGPWLETADHVWRFFLKTYQRPDGLLRTKVSAEGAPLDEDAYLYDNAFALMAAATFFRADPTRTDVRDAAQALRGHVVQLMRAPSGRGFREAGDQPFQANAHMHLFEACLAWVEAGGGPEWLAIAEEIASLAMEMFLDPEDGFLREFFDADWNPAPGPDGRHTEPGHQFEWAWLLSRWARLEGGEAAAAAARRLYQHGRDGFDETREVAINAVNMPGNEIADAQARLWPQTEAIKAGLILGRAAQGERAADDIAFAARAAAGLWKYFDVPTPGVWRDKMQPDGSFVQEPAPASSFYHILGAILALKDAA